MSRVISTVKDEKLVDIDCLEGIRNGWKKRSSFSPSSPILGNLLVTITAFVLRDHRSFLLSLNSLDIYT